MSEGAPRECNPEPKPWSCLGPEPLGTAPSLPPAVAGPGSLPGRCAAAKRPGPLRGGGWDGAMAATETAAAAPRGGTIAESATGARARSGARHPPGRGPGILSRAVAPAPALEAAAVPAAERGSFATPAPPDAAATATGAVLDPGATAEADLLAAGTAPATFRGSQKVTGWSGTGRSGIGRSDIGAVPIGDAPIGNRTLSSESNSAPLPSTVRSPAAEWSAGLTAGPAAAPATESAPAASLGGGSAAANVAPVGALATGANVAGGSQLAGGGNSKLAAAGSPEPVAGPSTPVSLAAAFFLARFPERRLTFGWLSEEPPSSVLPPVAWLLLPGSSKDRVETPETTPAANIKSRIVVRN